MSEEIPVLTYRERISSDLNANLDDRPHEAPVDRLLAFSYTPQRGSTALWRLKYDLDYSVYGKCVDALVRRLRIRGAIQKRMADLAIFEWLNRLCQHCHGAKELVHGQRRIICRKCKGLGIQRYSNRRRAEITGIDIEIINKHGRLLARLHEQIDKFDRAVNGVMALKLG